MSVSDEIIKLLIMNIHAARAQENKNHVVSNDVAQNKNTSQTAKVGETPPQFVDNRPEITTQMKLQTMARNSLQANQTFQLQAIMNNRAKNSIQEQGIEEEELLQGKFKTVQKQSVEEEELLQGKFHAVQKQEIEEEELLQGKFDPVQKQENDTGLPDHLKSGIENLSGYSMDDVQVHYNSDKPEGLQAHAYAQGTDIHLAPGQEKHLPHEAWHVVQQKQGRVKPTKQLQDKVNVNDDKGLEKEADVMGGKALQRKVIDLKKSGPKNKTSSPHTAQLVIQRLSLNNTNWSQVTTIAASAGGVGGVLFMSDASSTLVVKPNVEKDEEMIASHLHGAMSQPPRDNKLDATRWHIASLTRRFATAADVHDIQNQIPGPVLANALTNAKAANLLGQIAVNTTMIQEKVGNNAETFEDLLEAQKNAKNIIPGADRVGKNRKDKLRSESPLKPLTKSPSFAIALGQLAATDIFLGNFDRLVWAANIGNMMLDPNSKTIFPIDNVDNASTVRFTPHPGNPAITLQNWRDNKYVRWLTGRSWNLLANDIWGGPLVMQNLLNDILGHTDATETASVQAKLNKHLDEIKLNFIDGLKQGRADIISAGPLPVSPSWSAAARNLYNQRLNDL